MYFRFLLEVLKRALTAAPRVTDMLQILAASALPATSHFVGIQLPQNAGEKTLAYIGLVALSFVVIRLFWAPYAIWKDGLAETANLKLELSKPERLVVESMAKIKAKVRLKLCEHLNYLHLSSFCGKNEDKKEKRSQQIKAIHKAYVLSAKSGLSADFHVALRRFSELCERRLENELSDDEIFDGDFECLELLQRYVHDSMSDEDLIRLLPQGIVRKAQP